MTITPTAQYVEITLPAYGIGESITLRVRPVDVERVQAVSHHLPYGPMFRRHILLTLQDMSDRLRDGWLEGAERALAWAEDRVLDLDRKRSAQ